MLHSSPKTLDLVQKQMQNHTISQQWTILIAAKLYQDLKLSRPLTPPSMPNSPLSPTSTSSSATAVMDDQELVLFRYQHKSLGQYYYMTAEQAGDIEMKSKVYEISLEKTQEFLQRWTRKQRKDSTTSSGSVSPKTSIKRRESATSQASEPKLSRTFSLPIYQPTPTSHPSQSLPRSSEYLSVPPLHLARTTSTPNPIGLGIASPTGPAHSPRAPSVLSSNDSTQDSTEEPPFRHRLRLEECHWDFTDGVLTNTNTIHQPDWALKKRGIITEVLRAKIARAAMEETDFRYEKVNIEDRGEWGKSGRSKIRTFWRIRAGLEYEELVRLVERTKEIEEERAAEEEARKNAERNSRGSRGIKRDDEKRGRDRSGRRGSVSFKGNDEYQSRSGRSRSRIREVIGGTAAVGGILTLAGLFL
jgi:hypothetical protein